MTDDIRDCPECEQGKHTNCDTTAWDNASGDITVCPCYARNHQ